MATRKKAEAQKKKRTVIAKGVSLPRGKERQLRKAPGGGNVGKYKTVEKGEFCGPAGGSPEGSFPVNTVKRARNALARAHYAPNPEGIAKCVHRKWPQIGQKKSVKGKKK